MDIYEIERDIDFEDNQKGYDIIILSPDEESEQGKDNSESIRNIFKANAHFNFQESIDALDSGRVTIKVKTKCVYKVVLLLMMYGYEIPSWEKLEEIKQRSSISAFATA